MFHEDFQGQSLYFQSSGYIRMEVFQGGFLHCIHAAGDNLIHQTAMFLLHLRLLLPFQY